MKKLLIVVDFQNDFVDGTLGFEKAKELDIIISNKIKKYKNNNHDVIYTFDTHYDEYFDTLEGQKLPVKHCILGTSGHNLYGNVASLYNKEEDVTFLKETFPSLDLANYLKEHPYDEVELCGLVSNICVLTNVVMVKAALPNCKIIVDRNATASFDEKLNNETFDILNGIHVEVI